MRGITAQRPYTCYSRKRHDNIVLTTGHGFSNKTTQVFTCWSFNPFLRVARGAEAMSNQQSHPFVAPDEYERNKNTIAGYRAYLDMYERMNEQGLHNHAEFERAERMLQERVRQGEEAQ